MTVFLKDPNAQVDYTIDWNDSTDPYLASGETISTSAWAVDPQSGASPEDDIEIASDGNTDTTTTVTVTGGVAGRVYRLTNRITTSASRTDDRSIVVRVENR